MGGWDRLLFRMNRLLASVLLLMACACTRPEPRLSYEERYPDARCREEAFSALSSGMCPGCYVQNQGPDGIMDAAYRKCMAGGTR